MKLSKVKKVCLDAGSIIVKRADTGIDITTWVGCNSALYPVRGLEMNVGLAVRIWEIEEKKLQSMEVLEDIAEDETPTLITREDLEKMAFLADCFQTEDEEKQGMPGLAHIATINNHIVLKDRKTKKAWVFLEEKLGPVEGGRPMFIPVEEGRNLIAVYANGMLEAAIYAAPWRQSDYMKSTIREIAEIYNDDDVYK